MQRFYNYALRLGFVLACALFVGIFVPQAAAQTAVPPPPLPMSQLDMTGDDLVTTSDVTRVVSAWLESQQVGQCSLSVFAQRDVNKDGCIDVVDAQLVAAQLGAVSGPNHPLLGAAARAAAVDSTFVVNSKGNGQDANLNDNLCATGFTITVSGKTEPECTLRAAIEQANFTAGHETITFNVRNADGSCPSVVTIAPPKLGVPPYQLGSEDLAIESYFKIDDAPNNYGMTIDGYTQCGAKPNDQNIQGNAVIKIELKGQRQIYGHGILISSSNNIIRGLAIYDWDRKIMIDSSAKNNRIQGNFIGTNAAQTSKEPNMAPMMHSEGLRIQFGPSYNIVGCGAFEGTNFVPCTDRAQINAARNIVIGNGNDGVHLQGNTFYNRIVGNYIGLRQGGETCDFNADWLTNRNSCGNGSDGVDFESGPQYNWLGGETEGERNVISGNGSDGIELSHSRNTKFNRIVGNYFGMNAAGNKAVRNINNGISYEDTVNNNTSYNNIVSGNAGNGLRFYNSATLNEFRNNIVGFAADGVTPLPNGLLNASLPASEQKGDNGVLVMGGSHNNLIVGNRIGNHLGYGILLTHSSTDENRDKLSTSYNTISKNSIYDNGKNGIFWWNSETDANMNLAAPKLILASTRLVAGSTCAGCKIEVFIADTTSTKAAGSGKTFIGEGVADSNGNFAVSIEQTAMGQVLTATTTDPEGNTSQFSMNIQVTQDASVFETATAAAAQATANAQATTAAMTAVAQTATAQAEATQTTIVVQTAPALAATATAQAAQTATSEAATAAALSPTPAQVGGKYTVLLPMISR